MAISTLITQLLVAAAHIIAAGRVFELKTRGYNLLRLSLYTIFLIVAANFLFDATDSWFLNMCLFLAAGFVTAFVSRLISLKTIYQIVRFNE